MVEKACSVVLGAKSHYLDHQAFIMSNSSGMCSAALQMQSQGGPVSAHLVLLIALPWMALCKLHTL